MPVDQQVQVESVVREIEYRDPILLFFELCRHKPNCLMLESGEIDTKRHLNSFILLDAALRIECHGSKVLVTALTENGLCLLGPLAQSLSNVTTFSDDRRQFSVDYELSRDDLDEDKRLVATNVFEPLRNLRQILRINSSVKEALFVGGLFAFDLVASFEPLPPVEGQATCPDYVFYVAETLIHLDHLKQGGELISSWFYETYDAPNRQANDSRLAQLQKQIESLSLIDLPPVRPIESSTNVNIADDEFRDIVQRLKEKIFRGVVFQAVPSRYFSMPCPDPLRAYRQLRKSNPESLHVFHARRGVYVIRRVAGNGRAFRFRKS